MPVISKAPASVMRPRDNINAILNENERIERSEKMTVDKYIADPQKNMGLITQLTKISPVAHQQGHEGNEQVGYDEASLL